MHNDWSNSAYQNRTQLRVNKIHDLNKKYSHLGIDFNKIITGPTTHTSKIKKNEEEPTTSKQIKKDGKKLINTLEPKIGSIKNKYQMKLEQKNALNKGSLKGVTKKNPKQNKNKALLKAVKNVAVNNLQNPALTKVLKQKK